MATEPKHPLGGVLDPQQVVDQGAVAVLEDVQRHLQRPGTAPSSAGTSGAWCDTATNLPVRPRPATRRAATAGCGVRAATVDWRHDPPHRPAGPQGPAPVDYRTAVPRADFDVEAAVPAVRADLRGASATGGLEAILELSRALRRRPARRHPGPPAALRGRPRRRSTPRSAPAWRSRSAASARPARPSSSTTSSPTWARAPGSPSAWCRSSRVGLYVPGGIAPLVSSVRDERRARPRSPASARSPWPPRRRRSTAGCRTPRSWPRARCSASTRCTPSAAPRRSRCSPTAPARAPGRPGHRARQHLHRHRQAAAQGRGRHRLRGRAHRDRGAGRRHRRPGLRRRRPDQPGRARPAGRLGAGHASRVRSPTSVEAELDKQVAATRHVERIRTALAGRAVRRSCWSTTSSRGSRWSTPTPPSTSRSRPRTPRPGPPGCATPARSSSARYAPVSLGDYCAGSNHVLPTGGCACHSSGLSVRAFLQGRARRRLHPRGAAPRSPHHVVTLAEAEDLPGHGAAVRVRVRRHGVRPGPAARRPAAARGPARHRAVRRAAARRPGRAQRQREPVPARRGGASTTIAARSREAAATLNRYPDREFAALREALAGYLRPTGPVAASRSGPRTAPTR